MRENGKEKFKFEISLLGNDCYLQSNLCLIAVKQSQTT